MKIYKVTTILIKGIILGVIIFACTKKEDDCVGYYPSPSLRFTIIDSSTGSDILFGENRRYFEDSIEILYSHQNQIIKAQNYSAVHDPKEGEYEGYFLLHLNDDYTNYLIKFNYTETDTLNFEYLYNLFPCSLVFCYNLQINSKIICDTCNPDLLYTFIR